MAEILLVDDEEALRLMMSRQLRRAGHNVTQAEDGLAALELLKNQTFDVVVSDMKMPRLDGMGLLEQSSIVAPDVEFIILTGHGSMENALEAFKKGNLFDYLLKPLEDIHELDAVVERAAERRFLRHDNSRLVKELQVKIEDLEAARSKLAVMAERDSLTGLFNHRKIHESLSDVLANDSEVSIGVVLMDMDGFKTFNDTYGHPVGDQVLRHLADTLTRNCRDGWYAGRCGGDEFMLVLPNSTSTEAQDIAERVRVDLSHNPFRSPNGMMLPLQLCFGVAHSDSVGRNGASLVAAADSALYESKHSGGDTVTVHRSIGEVTPDTDRSKFDILDSLVVAIDHKDRYTKKHSEDVTDYALRLVEALGLSEDAHHAIRVAGLLHDVGKIGVPDSILRKPGKLTDEEYEVMKSHVTVSALIIHGLPRLPEILSAVANHHERWDGKGYPAGLSGEEIPLLGRIMAIADAFSAMTLDRPYRAGMGVDAALQEIEKHKGSQFDPELACVFIETMRSKIDTDEMRAAA